MCAEFGEVTVIIGLVINFLAFRLTIVRISWHLNISSESMWLPKTEPTLSYFLKHSKISLLNSNVGMGLTIGYWCYELTFWTPWFRRWGLVEPLSLSTNNPAFNSTTVFFFNFWHSTAGRFEWIPSVGQMTELMDSLSSSDDRIGGFPQQVGCWNCQQVDSLSRSEDRIDGFPQQL